MTLQRDLNAPEGDRSWLSAAADGDLASLDRVARAWRADAEVRKTWHAYHLIGDALRSAELAQPAARDADFLNGVRARLAKEPVVLAPAPTAPVAPPRRVAARWAVPAAVAAGFVVVAGVLVVSRGVGPISGAQDVMAGASSPSGVISVSTLGAARTTVAQGTGTVLRDARVDELLRVHQASRGGMVVPGSGLRRVDNVVPAEPAR